MKRGRTLFASLAVVAASLLCIAAFQAMARPTPASHLVARGPFRNEVLAYGQLQAVRSTAVSVPPTLQRPMRIAWLHDAGAVKKGELVVVFDAFEVEKQYEDGRSDKQSAEEKMLKARVEGKNSGTALKLDKGVAEEELKRAEDVAPTDAQIFSRNEILESQSDRNLLQKRVTTTDQKRDPTERLAAADVALADIEKRKAEMRLRQAQDSLNSLRVAAPHDGILVFPMSWRGDAVAVGDTVWPSQPLAELPDLGSLEAHVFVLEGDGGGLAAGQKARVEIEGQPGLAFDAKIARVDAVAKTRDRNSPVKYFETTLSFDAEAVAKAGLKPGQKVRASVLIDYLSDVVAIPRGGLFEKDGRRTAYRLERGKFVPVEIKVGRRSVGKVVVEQGLAPGDRIALYDPERRASAPGQTQAGPALGPAGR